jgi:hypothetical protein
MMYTQKSKEQLEAEARMEKKKHHDKGDEQRQKVGLFRFYGLSSLLKATCCFSLVRSPLSDDISFL